MHIVGMLDKRTIIYNQPKMLFIYMFPLIIVIKVPP